MKKDKNFIKKFHKKGRSNMSDMSKKNDLDRDKDMENLKEGIFREQDEANDLFSGESLRSAFPRLSEEKANQWRADLLKEIDKIKIEEKTSPKPFTYQMYKENAKKFLCSQKISYGMVAVFSSIFFLSGFLLTRLDEFKQAPPIDVAETMEGLFLPGTQFTNVHFTKKPSSRSEEISFIVKTSTPIKVEGSTTDEFVKKLMSQVLISDCNTSSKLECLAVISETENLIKEKQIQDAICYVLLNDKSPEIRLKAMQTLVKTGFAPEFQKTLAEVIQADNDNYIRTMAAELMASKLQAQHSIKLDGGTQRKLADQLQTEENRYIRNKINYVLLRK